MEKVICRGSMKENDCILFFIFIKIHGKRLYPLSQSDNKTLEAPFSLFLPY